MITPDTLTLRPIRADDEEFLYRVYAASREEELAQVPWEQGQKEAFLRMQFAAQHHHYQKYYADAAFLVIEREDAPIGRIYIHRGDREIRLMEISLMPQERGKGVGTALLSSLLEEADAGGKMVSLYVETYNRACRLYARFGFERVGEEGVYYRMERPPRSEGAQQEDSPKPSAKS